MRDFKLFSNHIAEKIELETATIIDFYDPEQGRWHSLWYFFDKKHSSLAITGDFGELVAVNFDNMGDWKEFYQDYTNNPGYFIEKVQTSRRSLFAYDCEEAKKEVLNSFFYQKPYEALDDDEQYYFDELFEYFDDSYGFRHVSDSVREFLSQEHDEYYVILEHAGRHISDIVYLYLDAYSKAYEYLTKNEAKSQTEL